MNSFLHSICCMLKCQISQLFLYSIFISSSCLCCLKEGCNYFVIFHTFIYFMVEIQKLFSFTLPEISVFADMIWLSHLFYNLLILNYRVELVLYCTASVLISDDVLKCSAVGSVSFLNMYSSVLPFFVFSAWPPCSVPWPMVMCHSFCLCYGTALVGRTHSSCCMHREWVFSLLGQAYSFRTGTLIRCSRQASAAENFTKSISIFRHHLKTLTNVRN